MPRSPLAAALAVALLLASPAAASATAEGATIDKTGWWNRANTPTPTPAGPISAPQPLDVPEGDLVVGTLRDEPSAVAAIGIQPEAGSGATVESFTLTLREDPDAGNRGTDAAAIVACPIVSFWAGGDNGAWDTRPEADCTAARVAGQRADDGTWTFDLAPVAELWFDPFGTIQPDGVALLPDLEAEPTSFQVVWLGGDDIDVDLQATAGPEADDPFAEPAVPADPPSDAGLSSGPSGGGSSLFVPPRVSTPPSFTAPSASVDVPTAEPPADAPVADEGDEVAAPTPVARSQGRSRVGDLVGNWPVAGTLLVPLLLAVLAATSYWLGPAGQQPAAADRRGGGVSRALAVRTRTPLER